MARRTKRSRKPSRRHVAHRKPPRILGVPGHRSAPALNYTREYCLIGDRQADPSECRSLMGPLLSAHPMSTLVGPLHQIASAHFPQHVRHLRANMPPDARKGSTRKGSARKGSARKGAHAHRTSKRGAKRRRTT